LTGIGDGTGRGGGDVALSALRSGDFAGRFSEDAGEDVLELPGPSGGPENEAGTAGVV
jgi:hypothetical protein